MLRQLNSGMDVFVKFFISLRAGKKNYIRTRISAYFRKILSWIIFRYVDNILFSPKQMLFFFFFLNNKFEKYLLCLLLLTRLVNNKPSSNGKHRRKAIGGKLFMLTFIICATIFYRNNFSKALFINDVHKKYINRNYFTSPKNQNEENFLQKWKYVLRIVHGIEWAITRL